MKKPWNTTNRMFNDAPTSEKKSSTNMYIFVFVFVILVIGLLPWCLNTFGRRKPDTPSQLGAVGKITAGVGKITAGVGKITPVGKHLTEVKKSTSDVVGMSPDNSSYEAPPMDELFGNFVDESSLNEKQILNRKEQADSMNPRNYFSAEVGDTIKSARPVVIKKDDLDSNFQTSEASSDDDVKSIDMTKYQQAVMSTRDLVSKPTTYKLPGGAMHLDAHLRCGPGIEMQMDDNECNRWRLNDSDKRAMVMDEARQAQTAMTQ